MIDFDPQAGEAFEEAVESQRGQDRLPWAVIAISAGYLIIRFIPWALAGFPVVR